MTQKEGSFKQLDKMTFKQVDSFLGSQAYRQIADSMRDLPDQSSKIASQVGHLFYIGFPAVVVLIFAISNFAVRSKLNKRNEALQTLKDYVAKKRELTSLGASSLNNKPITNREMFQSKIKRYLTQQGIADNKLVVTTMEDFPISKEIARVEVTVNFRSIGVSDLMSAISTIQSKEKVKIGAISIAKNSKEKTLSGSMRLVQLGKSQ